jgi:4-hydroxybenzoate polyprenyltransferase
VCASYGVLAVVILTAYCLGLEIDVWKVGIGLLIVFLYSCAIIGHNDFYDVSSDRIAHPWRGYVRGLIERWKARSAVIVLFGVCILLSWLLSFLVFLILIINISLGVLYNRWLKRRVIGVFIVSLAVAMVIPYGVVLVVDNPFLLWQFFIGLFCAEVFREIGVTVQDYKGDKGSGFKTIAVLLGRRRALDFSVLFLLISIPLFLSHHFGWLGAVKISNGVYLVGATGYVVLLGMAYINSRVSYKVIELNYRFAGRFYLLLFQTLMILEGLLYK